MKRWLSMLILISIPSISSVACADDNFNKGSYACKVAMEIVLPQDIGEIQKIQQVFSDHAKKYIEKKGMSVCARQCGVELLYINISHDDDTTNEWSVGAESYSGGDCKKKVKSTSSERTSRMLDSISLDTFRPLFVVGGINVKAREVIDDSILKAMELVIDNFLYVRNEIAVEKCGVYKGSDGKVR